MKFKQAIALTALASFVSLAPRTHACTTIGLQYDAASGQQFRLVAKSYDWHLEDAYVFTNKKGVKKDALVFTSGAVPATWVSRYNSVTFNQYGRELPNSGMNEAGLVVEVMVLDNSGYPASDDRPLTNETQIVQQALDTAGSVEEALPLFTASRMSPVMIGLHYLLCDLKECAIVEYRNGREMIYYQNDLPYKSLTNNNYEDSKAYLRQHDGYGGARPIPATGQGSLDRFAIGASAAAQFAENGAADPVDYGFRSLKRVETSATRWQVVYDQINKKISFRTRSANQIKTIDLTEESPLLAGNCKDSGVLMLPLVNQGSGDRTNQFVPYSDAANASMVRRHLMLSVPLNVISAAVRYPSTTVCQ